jgi:hypothetical protein
MIFTILSIILFGAYLAIVDLGVFEKGRTWKTLPPWKKWVCFGFIVLFGVNSFFAYRKECDQDAKNERVASGVAFLTNNIVNLSQITANMQGNLALFTHQSYTNPMSSSEKPLAENFPAAIEDFNRAVSAQRLGRTKEAEDLYKSVIQNNPNCSEAYNNLGTIYEAPGKNAMASNCFRRAFLLNKTNSAAAKNYSSYLALSGNHQEAVDVMDNVNTPKGFRDLLYIAEYAFTYSTNTTFFKFLDWHVRSTNNAELNRIMPMVKARWSTLTAKQVNTLTNWTEHLKPDDRARFTFLIEGAKRFWR